MSTRSTRPLSCPARRGFCASSSSSRSSEPLRVAVASALNGERGGRGSPLEHRDRPPLPSADERGERLVDASRLRPLREAAELRLLHRVTVHWKRPLPSKTTPVTVPSAVGSASQYAPIRGSTTLPRAPAQPAAAPRPLTAVSATAELAVVVAGGARRRRYHDGTARMRGSGPRVASFTVPISIPPPARAPSSPLARLVDAAEEVCATSVAASPGPAAGELDQVVDGAWPRRRGFFLSVSPSRGRGPGAALGSAASGARRVEGRRGGLDQVASRSMSSLPTDSSAGPRGARRCGRARTWLAKRETEPEDLLLGGEVATGGRRGRSAGARSPGARCGRGPSPPVERLRGDFPGGEEPWTKQVSAQRTVTPRLRRRGRCGSSRSTFEGAYFPEFWTTRLPGRGDRELPLSSTSLRVPRGISMVGDPSTGPGSIARLSAEPRGERLVTTRRRVAPAEGALLVLPVAVGM